MRSIFCMLFYFFNTGIRAVLITPKNAYIVYYGHTRPLHNHKGEPGLSIFQHVPIFFAIPNHLNSCHSPGFVAVVTRAAVFRP